MTLTIAEAVSLVFEREGKAIATSYGIGLVALDLYREGAFQGRPLATRKSMPGPQDIQRLIDGLISHRVIARDPDFGGNVFRILRNSEQGAEDACCQVDPFCYVSHLSAMQRHGLTDRAPRDLHLTTLGTRAWRIAAKDAVRQETDQRGLRDGVLAPMPRYGFPATVRHRPVVRHERAKLGAFGSIPGSGVRVAGIGQTFADMVSSPELCGGMRHVMDIWEESARDFLDPIMVAVEMSATKVAQVRAGFILEEHLGVRHPRIDAWKTFAQRGGSRKLDPQAPFNAKHSSTWMLSLNV